MKKFLLIAIIGGLFCLPSTAQANLHVLEMTSAEIISNVCGESAVIHVEWRHSGCQWDYTDLERSFDAQSWQLIAEDVERSYSENCQWDDLYDCTSCTDYFEYTDTVDRDYGYVYYRADHPIMGSAENIVYVFLGCDAPPVKE